ncbi:MAG: PEGA domain-containing protein [Myxococcota bacterium]
MALGLATVFAPGSARADRRVPIAVMDLPPRGVQPAAAAALATEVANALNSLRVFRVITREDIKRMLQLEQTRQQCTGEADAACLAEIGGALGVEYLVYGEVSRLGDPYSLSLVLLDIGRAEAVNRARAQVSGAGALLEETARATRRLVQPLLTDRTGYLVIESREPGAEVTIDGRLSGITPLPGRLELAMGPHEVVVQKQGFLSWARTVDLEPGQATVAPVALVPSQAFVASYEQSARNVRTAAWLTAGAGVALIGTGLVLALVADARFDDLERRGWLSADAEACAGLGARPGELCPTNLGFQNQVLDEVDDIETLDTLALGATVLGGAAALGSAVLFLTGDDPDRYRALTAVGIGPRGVHLRLEY